MAAQAPKISLIWQLNSFNQQWHPAVPHVFCVLQFSSTYYPLNISQKMKNIVLTMEYSCGSNWPPPISPPNLLRIRVTTSPPPNHHHCQESYSFITQWLIRSGQNIYQQINLHVYPLSATRLLKLRLMVLSYLLFLIFTLKPVWHLEISISEDLRKMVE